ncbi:hypothetical protein BFP70_18415 [Thioclava sp. SK-1]|uniref:phosphatase PAP2 family protein n=1 Tax=Thioclava sp. SK-1 TaxID=1889770 RepID=UPI00082461F7|nr:phosphatase PAP2 family protein [Thioclava sp. SK-1]OCX59701.1 hypothetical protein BFP70_18415 [Thioclava sp. SK-1]
MPEVDLRKTGIWLLIGWIAATALFRGAPEVDLWIAALPYRTGHGFGGLVPASWEWLRLRIWDLSIILFLVSIPLWALARKIARPVLRVSARGWAYVFWLYLLGPVIIVNGILKAYSGRARPYKIEEFGGELTFTPVLQLSDQCSRNCSFVSGEVAAAVVLSLLIWMGLELWRRHMQPWTIYFGRAVAVFITGFICAQRIVDGRHFASDTVFAALVVLSVAWVLYGFLNAHWASSVHALVRRRIRRG